MKKRRMKLTKALLIPIMSAVLLSNVEAVTSSGIGDIDMIRAEVKEESTSAENAASRRSALLRWWRLMWHRGQDMTPFDDVAKTLLATAPDSEANWAAVDRGYAVMGEMLKHPAFIPEKRGQKLNRAEKATNWPYYGGATGHNTGYSPDPGPSEGKLAWRFPKGFTWEVVPVIEDGRVYLSSPGIDVSGFCLDEETGDVLWRARQYGERFYGSPRSKFDPVVSRDRMLVRVGKNNQKMLIFDKQTGQRINNGNVGESSGKEAFAYERGQTYIVLADATTGQDIWSYNLKSVLSGEPQTQSGSIYAAGQSGVVVGFDRYSYEPKWRVDLGERIAGKLSVGNRAVYAGAKSGVLYALDKTNGSVLWKFDTKKPEVRANQYFSSALEEGNRLYFGTASSEVYCINARNGDLIWKHSVSDWVRARPVKVEDTIYVATLNSRLYALKEEGNKVEINWVQNLGVHGITADLVAGNKTLLASGRDYIMYSVDYDSGAIRWRHGILDGAWIDGDFIYADYTAALPGTPTVADGIVYIGGADGFVNALDVETGKEIWKFEAGEVITGAVSLIDGKAIFGRIASAFDVPEKEDAPPLFAVDQKSGMPVWISREYGNIWIGAIKPKNNDKVMFVGDMSGYVYGVDPDNGQKLWEYYTAKDTPQEDKPHDHHKHGWPPGVYCMPVVDEECFYVGSWSGYYFAFEHETGKLRWRTQTGWPETGGGLPDSAAPTLHKNYLYVQKQGHKIAAINIHSGEIDWEWQAPVGFLQNGTLAALGDRVYGSVARRVTHIPFESWTHCFADVESGSKLLWSYPSGGALSAPVITDEQLIFGSSTGVFLTSLDPQTGELKWRLYTGGEMTENVPAIYGDMLFSVSKNGWLNAVK